MTVTLILVGLLGVALGYWAGIVRAEIGIARSQMKRTWSGRSSWRS